MNYSMHKYYIIIEPLSWLLHMFLTHMLLNFIWTLEQKKKQGKNAWKI